MKKLTAISPLFPTIFLQLPQPPKEVFISGNEQLLKSSQLKVAIVGSRKVSPYGREVTARLARELAERGITVVSGLALGVDSIAHKAALEAGGTTMAILPGSISKIYPASHNYIARNILEKNGLLLSEYSDPQATPMKHQFIARNRLIAAIADVVVITEAAEASGSLHTANFALETGKNVLAVPGPINSPTSLGTNNLLKNGAGVITEVGDILLALGLDPRTEASADSATVEEALILTYIKKGVIDASELLHNTGLSAQLFNQNLTMLEITGRIRSLGNNLWTLA